MNTARPQGTWFLVPEKNRASQNRASWGLYLCTKRFFSKNSVSSRLLFKIRVSWGYTYVLKAFKMQERFCKVLGKVLKLWERFYRRKKWERFQNSRKGFKIPGKVMQWQVQSWKWGEKERERKVFCPSLHLLLNETC